MIDFCKLSAAMSVSTDSGCYHIQLPWLTRLQSRTAISMSIMFLKITVPPYSDYVFSGVRWILLTFQLTLWLDNQIPGHIHRNKVLTKPEKTVSKIFYQAANELHFIYKPKSSSVIFQDRLKLQVQIYEYWMSRRNKTNSCLQNKWSSV